MGLPHLDCQDIVGGHNDARSTLVQIDPVHASTHYHGADRSIRSTTARDSSSVGGSARANAASASNCCPRLNPVSVAA